MSSITLNFKAVAVTLIFSTFLTTSYVVGDTSCKKIKEVIPSLEQSNFNEPPYTGLGW